MHTLDELIAELQADGVLKTPAIINAFRAIDRVMFVPAELQSQAYWNTPLPIGFGQTISQPYTVAIMLEALQPKPREHVLDVGAGSGWVAALLAHLVGSRGAVTAVERWPQLTNHATTAANPLHLPQLKIMAGDGSRGWPAGAPYDIIHVAAAATAVPIEYKKQLAIHGRLVIPVGQPMQDLALITKTSDNTFTERRQGGFQFVPLISSSA